MVFEQAREPLACTARVAREHDLPAGPAKLPDMLGDRFVDVHLRHAPVEDGADPVLRNVGMRAVVAAVSVLHQRVGQGGVKRAAVPGRCGPEPAIVPALMDLVAVLPAVLVRRDEREVLAVEGELLRPAKRHAPHLHDPRRHAVVRLEQPDRVGERALPVGVRAVDVVIGNG